VQDEYLEYYSTFNEDQRLTCQNITRIEFDTTVHELSRYIESAQTITELGAATGRYSLFYAQQGLDVTSVELVPELVNQLRRNVANIGVDISIYESNATDVSFIPDSSQDIVLILGPLYHIQNSEERESVIREANRILKPNGIVAIAYISRFFVAGLLAKISGSLVTIDVLNQLNETGLVNTPNVDAFFRTGYFATPSEMEALALEGGFKILKHVATDGVVRYIGNEINQLTEAQYQAWLQHHLKVCGESTLLGSSNHGLVVAQKHS